MTCYLPMSNVASLLCINFIIFPIQMNYFFYSEVVLNTKVEDYLTSWSSKALWLSSMLQKKHNQRYFESNILHFLSYFFCMSVYVWMCFFLLELALLIYRLLVIFSYTRHIVWHSKPFWATLTILFNPLLVQIDLPCNFCFGTNHTTTFWTLWASVS